MASLTRRSALYAGAACLALPACRPSPPPAAPVPPPPPAGIIHIPLREGGLYGEFYAPAGATAAPALLLIGGSEGGLPDYAAKRAQDFAALGYAALVIAYFKAPGLPPSLEGIPLEYFDQALAWLAARPQVDPGRIGVVGVSRGSEPALMLAARHREVRAVMAVSPANALWGGYNPQAPGPDRPAWTLGGEVLPHLNLARAEFRRPGTAAIPVEMIAGPILLLTGGRDRTWPSGPMAEAIVARLRAHNFPHPVEHVTYPNAGHIIFVGPPPYDRPDPGGWAASWDKAVAFFGAAL